ncbi:MAG: helix-turn-helix domain-containing protein [Halobacteriales archaeon]
MTDGIRATVEFTDPGVCEVTGATASSDVEANSHAVNVCVDGCTGCYSEFYLTGEVDGVFHEVFDRGSGGRYRLSHEGEPNCPCEHLGRQGCAIESYRASDGVLRLSFYAADYDEMSAVFDRLRDHHPGLDVKRLVRAPSDRESDEVYVDRSRLTDRQREVLETARRMGYFEWPRDSTAAEVADSLDLDPSTVSEHLSTAQSKLVEQVLDG